MSIMYFDHILDLPYLLLDLLLMPHNSLPRYGCETLELLEAIYFNKAKQAIKQQKPYLLSPNSFQFLMAPQLSVSQVTHPCWNADWFDLQWVLYSQPELLCS